MKLTKNTVGIAPHTLNTARPLNMTTFCDLPLDLQRDIMKRKQIAEEKDRRNAEGRVYDMLDDYKIRDFVDEFAVVQVKWIYDSLFVMLKYKPTGRMFKITLEDDEDDDEINEVYAGQGEINKDKLMCVIFKNMFVTEEYRRYKKRYIDYNEMLEELEKLECLYGMNDKKIRRYKRETQTLCKVMGEIHFDFMFNLIYIETDGRPVEDERDILYYLCPDVWGLEEEEFDE